MAIEEKEGEVRTNDADALPDLVDVHVGRRVGNALHAGPRTHDAVPPDDAP